MPPVGQKRDRTFSDDFVKEYMDLDRFVDVVWTSLEGILVALTGIEPVF